MKGALAQTYIYRDREGRTHSRVIYSFIDLLGYVGGISEGIIIIFIVILLPISYHSFVVKATSLLFLAKTTEANLLPVIQLKGCKR